jgi:hypothetical protein
MGADVNREAEDFLSGLLKQRQAERLHAPQHWVPPCEQT